VVTVVNVHDSNDTANLELLSRPDLGVTFTKLHCWRLTQFDKCVFMDADTLVTIPPRDAIYAVFVPSQMSQVWRVLTVMWMKGF